MACQVDRRYSVRGVDLLQRCLGNEWSLLFGKNPLAAPGFFLQSSQAARQCGLCRRAHPIDKQNSVKMIVLVLNRARKNSARFKFNDVAFQILRADPDRPRAFNVAGDFRKTQAALYSHFRFTARLDFRIDQYQRHRGLWINIFAIQLERAWSVFDLRDVEHGQLQGFTDLLGRQSHAVGCVHRLEHVRRSLPNPVVDFLDPIPFGPQGLVAVLQNWQDHFSSLVKAGKFLTPASFNASITLMIVPKEAFLSACNTSVDLRASGKSFIAPSSSSTPTARPSNLIWSS